MREQREALPLNDQSLQRYSRQLILKGWSAAKQSHLGTLNVAISAELPAAALYLAGLGIGKLTLVSVDSQRIAALRDELLRLRPDLTVATTPSDSPDAAILLAGASNSLFADCGLLLTIDLAEAKIYLNQVPQELNLSSLAVNSPGILANAVSLLLLAKISASTTGLALAFLTVALN